MHCHFCARPLVGEQAQVDWAHFGKLTIGRAERPLMVFVLVLSYSRYPFCSIIPGNPSTGQSGQIAG